MWVVQTQSLHLTYYTIHECLNSIAICESSRVFVTKWQCLALSCLVVIILQAVNMDDIVSEFTCLKVSALSKVSRISAMVEMNQAVEPQNKDNSDKLENIENEQNLCNIKTPQKTNASSKLNASSSNGIYFSINKIHVENELQRKENVRVIVINIVLNYIYPCVL